MYLYCRGSFDEDPPYATINYDTGSNYSRPFRVKRYQDTDSDISGLTGRSDYLYGMCDLTGIFILWYNHVVTQLLCEDLTHRGSQVQYLFSFRWTLPWFLSPRVQSNVPTQSTPSERKEKPSYK